jgi:hypothetical protein
MCGCAAEIVCWSSKAWTGREAAPNLVATPADWAGQGVIARGDKRDVLQGQLIVHALEIPIEC